jgi:hypothetical protein
MRRPANEEEQDFVYGRFYRARSRKRRTQTLSLFLCSTLWPPASLLLELTLKSVWLNPVRDFDSQ